MNNTYGYIKKRVFDLLCENTACMECVSDDTNREWINSMLADTLNVCINRMYESLPIGKALTVCALQESEFCGLVKVTLPQDFFRLVSVNSENGTVFKISDGALYLPNIYHESVCVVYKKMPPQIDDNTSDEFEFDLSPIAIEALCVLCATELCRPEESALYTRLVYKYSDLSEGIYNSEREQNVRLNGFYKRGKKGWC